MHIFHKWKFLNAESLQVLNEDMVVSLHQTRVLYGCICGKRKVETFDGVWEDKDFV